MSTETLRLYAGDAVDVTRAAAILCRGGLVAFPTETVYGLGANAFDRAAVAKIFAAKGRPGWDPVIVHLAGREEIACVSRVPAELQRRIDALAEAFWPGALTLLLPRVAEVPDAVTAGRPRVGVRVPSHPVARALIHAAGVPLAAPSANLFGHTSPTTAAHVLADLDGRIDAVLDGGACGVGVESTVLDPCESPMVLYRPGAVTLAMIEGVAGHVVAYEAPAQAEQPESLPSPGVGLRHYAPRARLVLVSDAAALANECARAGPEARVGVMLPDGWVASPGTLSFAWGSWPDSELLARRVFAGLRELDDRGATVILCPLPSAGSGLREALRDRLGKAAMGA